MIGTRQTSLFYLESPSGDFYTSPFFLAFASVPPKLPPPEKGLIGEKSSSDHLIGARWYDPELGMFLGIDPAGQYANPYSYGGGSPVNGVDYDGRKFCIGGWCIGGGDSDDKGSSTPTTQDVVSEYQTNDKLQQAGDLYIKYANAMVLSAASAGGAAYLVSGWSAAATGYMGLATNSGLIAAMTGGGVTGLAAGGVSGFVGYSAANYDDWDAGDALQATLWGAGIGAATGAIFSGVGYGVSNGFRNATHQTVIEYGSRQGRYQDAIDYTAKNYKIKGSFSYDPDLGPRGITNKDGHIRIGPNAFSETDGSRLVAVMDHESAHVPQITDVAGVIPRQYGGASLPPNPSQGYIIHTREEGAYYYNLQQAYAHGYSQDVIDYTLYKYQESVNYMWDYLGF